MIARQNKRYCYKTIGAEMISKTIAGLIFIIFPTTMLRGQITDVDIFSRVVNLIYKVDAPTNLFPSLHCLESYICMKSALELKELDATYRVSMITLSILVFFSTVFIKQHVILDFFGAVVIAEAGRALVELFCGPIKPLFKKVVNMT